MPISFPIPIVVKSIAKPLHPHIDRRLFNQKYTAHENFWKTIYQKRVFIYLPLNPQNLKRYHIPSQNIWDQVIHNNFPPLYSKGNPYVDNMESGIFILCPIAPDHFIVIRSMCTPNWLFVAKDWKYIYVNTQKENETNKSNVNQQTQASQKLNSFSDKVCFIADQFEKEYESPLIFEIDDDGFNFTQKLDKHNKQAKFKIFKKCRNAIIPNYRM